MVRKGNGSNCWASFLYMYTSVILELLTGAQARHVEAHPGPSSGTVCRGPLNRRLAEQGRVEASVALCKRVDLIFPIETYHENDDLQRARWGMRSEVISWDVGRNGASHDETRHG
jgi:hypothetical protein